VLAFALLLAAGHRAVFAAVLHIATRFGILIGVLLRAEGQARGRNSQGRGAGHGNYKCFDFVHLDNLLSKNPEPKGFERVPE
jgi:hypothetical protein